MKPEGAKSLGFNNELWKMVELCWLENRSARRGHPFLLKRGDSILVQENVLTRDAEPG